MREDLIERLNRAAKKFRGTLAGNLYTQAAAALEAAREDGDKWAILSMRRGDWLELDIAMEEAEAAIDQARGIVPEAGQGVQSC